MNVITNQNNLKPLEQIISKAKYEICISSGWIRSGTLYKVLNENVRTKIKSGKIKLRVLLRLGEEVDAKITDAEVFKFVYEHNAELKYHKKQHAKVFIVDDTAAMLGSFNLTGGGFGDEYRAGSNPETGLLIKEKDQVLEIKKNFDLMWSESESLSDKTLGFVLNPSNHNEFYLAGIKDLPSGQFVQAKVGPNEYVFGKITLSEKYSNQYYMHPSEMKDFSQMNEFFGIYTSGEGIENLAKFTAAHKKPYAETNIAQVKILSRVKVNGSKVAQTLNLTPPAVGEVVEISDELILKNMFNRYDFAPGRLISNDIEVGFNPKEIYSKHLAIFGATGSGKSFFTKTLLSKYIQDDFCKTKGGRIIIFDPHGEYARALKGSEENGMFKLRKGEYEIINSKSEENLGSRIINDIDDLIDVCELKLDKNQKEYLSKQIRLYKKATKKYDFIDHLRKDNSRSSNDKTISFDSLKPIFESLYLDYLDPIEAIAKQEFDSKISSSNTDNDITEYLSELMSGEKPSKPLVKSDTTVKAHYIKMRTRQIFDSLDKDLQELIKKKVIENQISKIADGYLEKELKILNDSIIDQIEQKLVKHEITFDDLKLIDKINENKIYCIDMSDIHDEEIRWEIAHGICKKIFDDKKEGKGLETVFVVEEAHNFAPESGGKNNPAGLIIKKIAQEGRKFGLGLVIITQRPASVAKGVLSQCNTQVIFRLVNQQDINAISEVVEGISYEELKMLPNFQRGQGIFTGIAIDQPVLIKTNESRL